MVADGELAPPPYYFDLVREGWGMREGKLIVPDTPGAGFDVEPDVIEKGVKAEGGFSVGRP